MVRPIAILKFGIFAPIFKDLCRNLVILATGNLAYLIFMLAGTQYSKQ